MGHATTVPAPRAATLTLVKLGTRTSSAPSTINNNATSAVTPTIDPSLTIDASIQQQPVVIETGHAPTPTTGQLTATKFAAVNAASTFTAAPSPAHTIDNNTNNTSIAKVQPAAVAAIPIIVNIGSEQTPTTEATTLAARINNVDVSEASPQPLITRQVSLPPASHSSRQPVQADSTIAPVVVAPVLEQTPIQPSPPDLVVVAPAHDYHLVNKSDATAATSTGPPLPSSSSATTLVTEPSASIAGSTTSTAIATETNSIAATPMSENQLSRAVSMAGTASLRSASVYGAYSAAAATGVSPNTPGTPPPNHSTFSTANNSSVASSLPTTPPPPAASSPPPINEVASLRGTATPLYDNNNTNGMVTPPPSLPRQQSTVSGSVSGMMSSRASIVSTRKPATSPAGGVVPTADPGYTTITMRNTPPTGHSRAGGSSVGGGGIASQRPQSRAGSIITGATATGMSPQGGTTGTGTMRPYSRQGSRWQTDVFGRPEQSVRVTAVPGLTTDGRIIPLSHFQNMGERRKGRVVHGLRWWFAIFISFLIFVLADVYSFVYVPMSSSNIGYTNTKLATLGWVFQAIGIVLFIVCLVGTCCSRSPFTTLVTTSLQFTFTFMSLGVAARSQQWPRSQLLTIAYSADITAIQLQWLGVFILTLLFICILFNAPYRIIDPALAQVHHLQIDDLKKEERRLQSLCATLDNTLASQRPTSRATVRTPRKGW